MVGLVNETANESARSVLGTSLYLTAGSISVATLPVLSGLLCVLLLMYITDSTYRDHRVNLSSVVHATPVRSSSLVLARLLTGLSIATSVVIGLMLFFNVQLKAQGTGFVSVQPFLLVWGVIMTLSLVLWMACVLWITGQTKNWVTAYACSLFVLGGSIYAVSRGWMDWSTNWLLWGVLRWSDAGALGKDHEGLLLNRGWVLALACLITILSIIGYHRVARDSKSMNDLTWLRRHPDWAAWVVVLIVSTLALMGYTRWNIYTGFQGEAVAQDEKAYWRQNMQTWMSFPTPDKAFVDVSVDLDPVARYMAVEGSYTVINRTPYPLEVLPFTLASSFEGITWFVDGQGVESENRASLHLISLPAPLALADTIEIGFSYEAFIPDGLSRNGGVLSHFILPSGVLLSSTRGDFLPKIGYDPSKGISRANAYDPVDRDPRFTHLKNLRPPGGDSPFMSRIRVTIPAKYAVTATGAEVDRVTDEFTQTTLWETQYPVAAINVMAGEWSEKRSGTNAVYFFPAHHYNADELLEALAAARTRYSDWFGPYPWRSLRISEFPNVATTATAYPTNISFSEGMGFLTRPESGSYLPYVVAAHEVAHQWWGHMVAPAYEPGADVLTEAMANYATARLLEVEKGVEARNTYLLWLQERYYKERRVDREQPLRRSTLGTPDGESVIYNKGALVLWMMHQYVGDESMDAALKEFVKKYARHKGLQPDLDDFLFVVRSHAEDPAGFDLFVAEWIDSVGERAFLIE